jgi:hypothetical protein
VPFILHQQFTIEGKKITFSIENIPFEANFATPLSLPSGAVAPPAIPPYVPDKHV